MEHDPEGAKGWKIDRLTLQTYTWHYIMDMTFEKLNYIIEKRMGNEKDACQN